MKNDNYEPGTIGYETEQISKKVEFAMMTFAKQISDAEANFMRLVMITNEEQIHVMEKAYILCLKDWTLESIFDYYAANCEWPKIRSD